MKRFMVLTLLIPLFLVACGGEEKKEPDPKEAPPPPPEPTVSEIKEQFTQPLAAVSGLLMSGQPIPPEMLAQINQQLRAVDQKFAGKKNLPAAKSEVGDSVEQALKQAETLAHAPNAPLLTWQAVLVAADLLAFFEPNNPNIIPAKEEAIRELNRPRIGKPSFITDNQNEVTTVFLDVLFPDRGTRENFQVREGEDFADGRFRLLKIIGRNQGVRILDVQDSKEFDIMRRERE
jgi:hypothetical protein